MASSGLLRPLIWIAVAALVAAVGWQAIAYGMSANLQDAAPEAALRWRPDNAKALVSVSEERLARGAADEAGRSARRALRNAPLEARAYVSLARSAFSDGRGDYAEDLMAHAGRLTRRDLAVSAWLYRDALVEGHYATAFLRADEMMRRAPSVRVLLARELVRTIADPLAISPMVQRLETSPPWRKAFLRELNRSAPDALALDLYRQLRDSSVPPTPAELSPLLTRMAKGGDYERAYGAWRAFIPPAALPSHGGVFDGRFERPPGPEPFGWMMGVGKGIEATIDPRGDGPGLLIRADGFADTEAARQLLLLPPGRYRLSSQARLEEGAEGVLEWRLSCIHSPRFLLKAPFAVDGQAEPLSAEFEVPAACEAQRLALKTVGDDRQRPVLIRVEAVQITRLGDDR